MRHLNVQEAEVFYAKEEKKEQDNLRKKHKAEAQKLAQEWMAKKKKKELEKSGAKSDF